MSGLWQYVGGDEASIRYADLKSQYGGRDIEEESLHVQLGRKIAALNKEGQVVKIGEEEIPFEIPMPTEQKRVLEFWSVSYAVKGYRRKDGRLAHQDYGIEHFPYQQLDLDVPQVSVYRLEGESGPWLLKDDFFAPFEARKQEVFAKWWASLPSRDRDTLLRWTVEVY